MLEIEEYINYIIYFVYILYNARKYEAENGWENQKFRRRNYYYADTYSQTIPDIYVEEIVAK